jgi:hypothetical protein
MIEVFGTGQEEWAAMNEKLTIGNKIISGIILALVVLP